MFQLRQFVRTAHQQFHTLCVFLTKELHTRRRAQLVAVVAVAVTIGLVTSHFVMAAHKNKSQWSDYQVVLVAHSAIRAGESITAQNTTPTRIPVVFLPEKPLYELRPTRTARTSLLPNTIISVALTHSGSSSVAIPEGWRGVAMPRDLAAPLLHTGDVVDVVSTDRTIAQSAVVIAASPTTGITIAVPADTAPAVATAFRMGDASLVLAQ